MSFARSVVPRGLRRSSIARPQPRATHGQQWHRSSRRSYASTTEKAKDMAQGASSTMRGDLPWLLGSVLVTVPSTYFILSNGSSNHDAHGAHGAHDEHHGEEEHEEKEGEGEEGAEQEPSQDTDDQPEEKDGSDEDNEDPNEKKKAGEITKPEDGKGGGDVEEKAGEITKPEHGEGGGDPQENAEADEDESKGGQKGSDDEGKEQDAADQKGEKATENSDEGDGQSHDDADPGKDATGRQASSKDGKPTGKQVQEQPKDNKISKKTASGEEANFDEEVELENDSNSKTIHRPDAKGGAKRRIESGNAKKMGNEETSETQIGDDKGAASKTPVKGQTSGKQAGLSNTDTKHSIDITKDPEKSKKSEGAPETAKLQGTVDSGRKLTEKGEKADSQHNKEKDGDE